MAEIVVLKRQNALLEDSLCEAKWRSRDVQIDNEDLITEIRRMMQSHDTVELENAALKVQLDNARIPYIGGCSTDFVEVST